MQKNVITALQRGFEMHDFSELFNARKTSPKERTIRFDVAKRVMKKAATGTPLNDDDFSFDPGERRLFNRALVEELYHEKKWDLLVLRAAGSIRTTPNG